MKSLRVALFFIPSKSTYGSVIEAFGKAQESKKALKFFYDMKQAGVEADTLLYMQIIRASLNSKQQNKALDLLLEGKDSGCQFNVSIYGEVMAAFAES